MLFVYIVFQTMLLNYFSCGLGSVNVVFFFSICYVFYFGTNVKKEVAL